MKRAAEKLTRRLAKIRKRMATNRKARKARTKGKPKNLV